MHIYYEYIWKPVYGKSNAVIALINYIVNYV